jgi:hypothetical protein
MSRATRVMAKTKTDDFLEGGACARALYGVKGVDCVCGWGKGKMMWL